MQPYNPAEDDLARIIKKGRMGVHIVYFPSIKNSRVIVCESKLEAEFCQWLEFDPDVVSYSPQPITINLWVQGFAKKYTPDFRVSYKLRPDVFYEVKPSEVQSWDAYMEMMAQAEQYFAMDAFGFRLMLEKEIRIEPTLSNMKFLYSKLHRVSDDALVYAKNWIQKMGGEVGYAECMARSDAPTVGALAKAIYSGVIEIDLSKRFDENTWLRLKGQS